MAREVRRSIDHRLKWAIRLTTGASLLVACIVFGTYDWRTGREALIEKSATLAQVVGVNSAVALTFDDAAAAEETLAGLEAAHQVTGAVLYDRSGEVFAVYAPEGRGARFLPPPVADAGHHFERYRLHVYQEIVFHGETVGHIYVRLDASALWTRMAWNAAIVGGLILAASVCAGLVAARLRRQIARPLEALVAGSEAITGGDLSIRVPEAGDDEIGALAGAFDSMTAGLRGLVVQVQGSIAEVSEVSRALERRAGHLFGEAKRQSAAVSESASSVDQVTRSIRDVNANVEHLAGTAKETSSSILEMDASIGEIVAHMDHLTSAIDTTSSAVSQLTGNIRVVVEGVDTLETATRGTLGRVRELSESVDEVRANAAESHALSEDSSREATEGMTAVGETIRAMGEIQTSFGELSKRVSRLAEKSESIDEIVQVIQDVAERTGLLSLNASIIAAQAGEHGRAFSVVAEQVNTLAERTHRSAREIAELIHAVQEDTTAAVVAVEEGSARVERGVQRSNVAGQVLDRILEKAATSTGRVKEIVDAAVRQSEDLARVDDAAHEVERIVEAINRSTHDQDSATAEIAAAVENIRNLGSGVRRSAEEQRRGSRLITKAASRVSEMVAHIADSTSAQTRGSETIELALQVFSDVSEQTTRGAESISASVATLSERRERLEREIGRFKTE